jgi:hypothetical protein
MQLVPVQRNLFIKLYLLAQSYGWKSAGTLPPEKDDQTWRGGYISNDGQLVKAKDAEAWCAALERAMGEASASTWKETPLARVRKFAVFLHRWCARNSVKIEYNMKVGCYCRCMCPLNAYRSRRPWCKSETNRPAWSPHSH